MFILAIFRLAVKPFAPGAINHELNPLTRLKLFQRLISRLTLSWVVGQVKWLTLSLNEKCVMAKPLWIHEMLLVTTFMAPLWLGGGGGWWSLVSHSVRGIILEMMVRSFELSLSLHHMYQETKQIQTYPHLSSQCYFLIIVLTPITI